MEAPPPRDNKVRRLRSGGLRQARAQRPGLPARRCPDLRDLPTPMEPFHGIRLAVRSRWKGSSEMGWKAGFFRDLSRKSGSQCSSGGKVRGEEGRMVDSLRDLSRKSGSQCSSGGKVRRRKGKAGFFAKPFQKIGLSVRFGWGGLRKLAVDWRPRTVRKSPSSC